MALRIRFLYATGSSLTYSVERLADGTFFDFGDSTFKPVPAALTAPLPEDTGSFLGRYKVNLATPQSAWPDGDYCVSVHDAATGLVADQQVATLNAGDDGSVYPVEAGVNARQALAAVLAALAGDLTGAGTGAISIKGGGVPATRIAAATDPAGNRTVTLTLPD